MLTTARSARRPGTPRVSIRFVHRCTLAVAHCMHVHVHVCSSFRVQHGKTRHTRELCGAALCIILRHTANGISHTRRAEAQKYD